jgi:hypothetical protein
LREVLCCIEQTTDVFQASIHAADLSNFRFDEETLGLERIPALERLTISNSNTTSFAQLSGCKALRQLSFLRCYSLSSEGLAGLDQLPFLEEVRIEVSGVNSTATLSGCKTLKKLQLSNSSLTSDGLSGLGSIPMLED